MKKITSKFMALLLSLLTIVGTMTTPAFAAEDLIPGEPGTLTERYIDESTSRELAPPTTSKSSWVKDAPAIEGYEFDSFSQTTDHIYSQEEITYIVGYPDKTVRGDRSLSRSEAAAIFYRLYNGAYPTAKQHMTDKTFSDVPASVWYYDELSTCYAADILSGCQDGKFRPEEPITRAEFAAMASAFAELPQAESAPFSDVSRSYWAYDDINSAAEAGWIVGYPDGTFRPESEISRAETVTLINRLRNRKITAEELRALGVQNPYTDLSESYWAYGELIEATVKHNAADWHKLNYNEDNLNTVVERFVDGEGNELAEPITTKGQAARSPMDFKNRSYLGYTTEITYVYRQGQAVMTGSKEVDKVEAKVGDTLQYTVTVGNDKSATGTLRNAIVSDTLSEHLGFVYGSVLIDGENTKYNFDVKTGLLSVNVGDIAAGESKQVSFAAIVKDTAYGETLSNTAVLSADNSEDIPVTDSSTKIEDGKPGLTAEKAVDKSEAHVGDTLTYTITAKNAENATAPLKNATLTDTLPGFVDFVQGSVMVDGASGQYSFDKGVLNVELGEIAPGAGKAVTFQVTVNNTAYNQSFQNTAILDAENSDPVVPSDEGVTVADGTAKMSVSKAVDKAKAKVGDTLTYTITASNADTATVPLRNAVMTDTLPKYVTFNQGSVAVDGNPVRTTFNSKTRQLTAELGDIAPGQSKVLTFSALVNNAAYGKKFSNTAILSADNSEETPATDTGVTVAAGVPEGSSGAKTVSKSKANVGDTLTYSIALRNASTATADWKNVKVTDAIPEHLAFVPGSVEVDGRSSNDYSYNADTHTLTLIADKIAIGKTMTYTFRVTVEDGAQGQYIVNTAKVTSPDREDMQLPDTGVEISGGQTEPIMTKTASVKKAKPGETFTYTVEVKNGAKATADWKNVVLSDVLPVGVELVGGTAAIDDTTTKYTLAGQVLEVKLGNLKPNESVRVTFQVKVLERAAEDIIRNVATAQGDNGKRTASDNGVEVGLGKGELSGTKTVSQTTAKVGDILTYTITAHNSDKVTANLKDVIVTDTLSEYLTLNPNSVQVDGLPARHFFDGTARQLRVELGDIAPGQTKTVTFMAAVNSNAYGKKFGNTAVITAKNSEGFSMRLHPGYFFEFLDHPFSINREVQDYKDLYESIKENGINEPVKARPREGGGLELLSGHRRHDIAKQLNYPVPVVIVREDDDTARIEVVDGNLHRQDIPTSELARAAKMKLDALTRKAGRRSKMEQLSGPQKRSDQQVAEDLGMSRNQVQRLVRIESLVPDLKQQVDKKEMPFNTAVELSYLKPEEQEKVVDFIKKEGVVPTMAQATEIKKASQEAAKTAPSPEKTPPAPKPLTSGSPPASEKTISEPSTPPKPAKAPAPLDEKKISSIVKPKAEPEIKYTFTSTELKEYFPKDKAPTVSEVKRKVFNALDLQKKAEERQKAKQAVKDAAKDR